MIKTYFLVALRFLKRNKAFSLLNIFGLSIGVAASILIFLVIRWENSYDAYHQNKDRVYRVVTTVVNKSNGEVSDQHAYAPVTLADAIRSEVTGVEKTAAILKMPALQVRTAPKGTPDEKIFLQQEICSADPELFNMLDVEWLDGNAAGLKDPYTTVVAASLADRWFGSWHFAIGKTIEMGSARMPLKIVGVFKDRGDNTDIPLEQVESYATLHATAQDFFTYHESWHYPARHSELFLMLAPGSNRSQVEAQLKGIVSRHYGEDKSSYTTYSKLGLQPLTDMHLNPSFETLKGDALSVKVLWSLATIGILLLVVASINFINLSTAQSVRRSKEVGVRKVLGSNRWQLVRQFMLETAVITTIALLLGCLLAQLALPWLQSVMHKPVTANWFLSPSLLLFLLSLGCLLSLFAGFYPAVVLSGFDVIEAIKNKITTRTIGGLSLRRSLVFVQFVVAQLLIIGTIVVVRQMAFFHNRPLGFEKDAIAMIELPSNEKYVPLQPYLKEKLSQVPGVEAAGFSNMPVADGSYPRERHVYFDGIRQDWLADLQIAEPDFVSTMRIPVLAGTLPDTNHNEVLVNETLVKRLGLHSPREVIGKRIAVESDSNLFYISGVVRDYHNQSLREALEPVVIEPQSEGYDYLNLRIHPGDLKATTAKIQKAFAEVYPDYLFDCSWVDERVAHFYVAEETTSQLVRAFAGLALVISGIGLYGLVAFMAVQRMKDIGIRKVLGASVMSIVSSFGKEFGLLTGLAFLVSAPIGYLVMHRWLEGFYYHVSLGWETFIVTLVLSLLISWLTVGFKAWQAASTNPIKSLKTE